jgi:acyl-coenzyme A thioesterase PaaI-like protein
LGIVVADILRIRPAAFTGAWPASLLDNALGAAVRSRPPAGARSATLNLNVSYLRGLTARSSTITA